MHLCNLSKGSLCVAKTYVHNTSAHMHSVSPDNDNEDEGRSLHYSPSSAVLPSGKDLLSHPWHDSGGSSQNVTGVVADVLGEGKTEPTDESSGSHTSMSDKRSTGRSRSFRESIEWISISKY